MKAPSADEVNAGALLVLDLVFRHPLLAAAAAAATRGNGGASAGTAAAAPEGGEEVAARQRPSSCGKPARRGTPRERLAADVARAYRGCRSGPARLVFCTIARPTGFADKAGYYTTVVGELLGGR
eukprot:TRINITY_DN678_c0_g1_i3.p1 TRINITY_DN678_c0_g1~~TRINITY_DN678_c0_g1_i3.p1  ORF type:complete len:136 (+),score=32.69 TRINITY_DN678_c0_g1_i3:36-410(+)